MMSHVKFYCLGFALSAAISCAHAQVSPMTQEDAFAAGSSAGSSNTASMRSNISGTKGSEIVGDYANTTSHSSMWTGGKSVTHVLQGGADQIVACDTGTGIAGVRDKNHCEAVNAIAKQPNLKPAGLVTKDDPLVVKGSAITANPEAVAGAMESLYSACETKTETSPGEKTVETCDDYATTGDVKCTIGQEVEVDADHLYKCKDSVKVTVNSQCTVGRVVEIDTDSNYQCVKTEIQHETLKCNKFAIVTVTPGNAPPPQNANIGGYWEPPMGKTPGKWKSWSTSTSMSVNPTAKTGQVAFGYRTFYCNAYFRVYVYAPSGGQIGYAQFGGCSASGTGYVNFAATESGTYRVYEYGYGGAGSATAVNFYGTFSVATTETVVNTSWDNQCVALEARAQ